LYVVKRTLIGIKEKGAHWWFGLANRQRRAFLA
jgi:hypothetical protein